MKVEVSSMPLTLRHTFRIAREASEESENVLLKLTDEDGVCGLGEAAPSSYYGQTAESVQERLGKVGRVRFREALSESGDIWNERRGYLATHRSALAAVDLALHDWFAKRLGVPLYLLFGLDPGQTPLTTFTIGLSEERGTPSENSRRSAEYAMLKLKLGTDKDREIVATVRRQTSVPYVGRCQRRLEFR